MPIHNLLTPVRVLARSELSALSDRLQQPARQLEEVPLKAIRIALLLGGQRWRPLLQAKRSDILQEDQWLLHLLMPRSGRYRSYYRSNVLPLTGSVRDEVNWLLGPGDRIGSEYIFPSSDPDQPLRPASARRLLTKVSHELLAAKSLTGPVVLSDLRRTCGLMLREFVPLEYFGALHARLPPRLEKRFGDHYRMHEKVEALRAWEGLVRSSSDSGSRSW